MKKIDSDQLLETIGSNLNLIRTARKEILEGVAESVGSTHPVLSKIENGRYPGLSLSLLIKLCNHYEVTLQQVLELEATQIFQCTQNNSGETTGNILRQVANEVSEGFHIAIEQYKSEVEHLRHLLDGSIEQVERIPIDTSKLPRKKSDKE